MREIEKAHRHGASELGSPDEAFFEPAVALWIGEMSRLSEVLDRFFWSSDASANDKNY